MKTSALFLQVVLSLVCAFGFLACEKDQASAPAANPASASPAAPASTAAAPSVASTTTAPAVAPSAPASSAPMPGSDRDAHGCIGSAGYRWCAKENACVRPWELATSKGFPNDASAFATYCH